VAIPRIETDRLILRELLRADIDAYHALFSDLEVIRYLPLDGPMPREGLDGAVERNHAHWERHGYGVWVVCARDTGSFVGQCGLRHLDDIGETELLYTVARAHWNQGLTTEAARASLEFGFARGNLERVIALAVPENRASTRVMEKVGMSFEEEQDIFGLHCARYAISATTWRERSEP
jgi:ribosomal-protein-alanine N-acetyltransferase